MRIVFSWFYVLVHIFCVLFAYKAIKDNKDIDAGGDTVPGLRFLVKYVHEPSLNTKFE